MLNAASCLVGATAWLPRSRRLVITLLGSAIARLPRSRWLVITPLGSAIARQPGLLGRTFRALGCPTHTRGALAPLRFQGLAPVPPLVRPARASSLRLRIVNPNTVTVTVTATASPTPTRIPTPALTLTLTRPAWRSWRACARPTCATTLRTPCSGSGASWPIFRASSGKESERARAPLV